jgi:hypothetical protein
MVGVVLTLPLWMVVAIALDVVERRRLRKAAGSFLCRHCGRALGKHAVTLADKAWSEHVRKIMRENPGVKYRMVRTVRAICPGCGTRYSFDESDRTFVVVQNSQVIA